MIERKVDKKSKYGWVCKEVCKEGLICRDRAKGGHLPGGGRPNGTTTATATTTTTTTTA